ncbi:AbrB/MazE/SpoVT family DNA-binding domain-containing protein [Candidatus Woesearchaeota archaeon]|nr:AbrB/MazE/SpoVT family DNA-binding domain-containing protein [Candidatus Woesearchaeota archaeon]
MQNVNLAEATMIVEMSKGRQITIPADVRDEFDLHAGSKLELIKKKDAIVLKPLEGDIEALFEQAKHIKPKRRLSAEQMDEFNERMMR